MYEEPPVPEPPARVRQGALVQIIGLAGSAEFQNEYFLFFFVHDYCWTCKDFSQKEKITRNPFCRGPGLTNNDGYKCYVELYIIVYNDIHIYIYIYTQRAPDRGGLMICLYETMSTFDLLDPMN